MTLRAPPGTTCGRSSWRSALPTLGSVRCRPRRNNAGERRRALGAHGAVDFQDAYQHPDRIAVVEALFNATDKNGEHMFRHLVPAALARHGVSTKIRASNGRGEEVLRGEMARLVVLRYLSCTSAYGCSRSSSAWTRS